jgi:hypothetical protein
MARAIIDGTGPDVVTHGGAGGRPGPGTRLVAKLLRDRARSMPRDYLHTRILTNVGNERCQDTVATGRLDCS